MTRTTEASPVPNAASTYILVHLDDYELGEGSLVYDDEGWDDDSYAELRRVVVREVGRIAAGCGRKIVIMDPSAEDHHPELNGKRLVGWNVARLDALEVTKVAAGVPSGSRVIVAGYARHDCVARVVAALERRGCPVVIHDVGTVPLTDRALSAAYRLR